MPELSAPPTAYENIETVARLEKQFLDQRTTTDRIGDNIADFIGTMRFVLLQLAAFVIWTVLNSGLVPGVKPWDPYPYILLAMLVSLEGVLLSTFVLMKQNRMSRRTEQRNHLDFQINLLAEKEITKILELQRLVCAQLGIEEVARDREAQELSTHTAVEELAQELEKRMPE